MREIPVPTIDVLPRWAEVGRLRPDDYLVNPDLDVCFQAKDVPDLSAVFRQARLRGLFEFLGRVRRLAMSCFPRLA